MIPARYGSTRLPGKPLIQLAGLPLIEHVRRRAARARGIERVIVATDDARIAAVVTDFGGDVVLTGGAESGTHRCRLALELLAEWPDALLNVQGDQPLLDPAHIEIALTTLQGAIATLAAPMVGDPADPQRVKVVTDSTGRALYFSRAAIPHGGPYRQHVGIYAFTPDGLRAATDSPRSALCTGEDLEQLAWLEAGLAIAVGDVDRVPPGVDTPQQLVEARRLLEA